MQRLIVVGGGEHARVVMEAIRSRPDHFELLGFVDPQPCEKTVRRLGLQRLGDDDALPELLARAGATAVLGVGAIGVSAARRALAERLEARGVRFASVVHAAAQVSPTATVEDGAVVMAGAMVQTGARVGRHAVVNTSAVLEHDVTLGDHAQAGPGALVGGGATVGAGSYLGLGSRVRDHVTLGENVTVGMGAVVVGSVAAGATVLGVPARARPEPEGGR